MSPVEATVDRLVSSALDELGREYAARAPFREDRAHEAELRLEAEPAVRALFLAAQSGQAPDLGAFEHRESLALFQLLGRRAAALALTPTAAAGLLRSVLGAVTRAAPSLTRGAVETLEAVFLEGLFAGHEDRLRADAARAVEAAQPLLRLGAGVLVLVLRGRLEPEGVRELIDRLGREALASSATTFVVDLAGLEEPTRERAAEVFQADATARMLGARAVFVGASFDWLRAAAEARLETASLWLEPSLEGALREAYARAGLELRPPRAVDRWLRRLPRRKARPRG